MWLRTVKMATAASSNEPMRRAHIMAHRLAAGPAQCQACVLVLPLLNRTVLPICSIEVSPHGDLLDEQKGSTAGRVAQGRAGRTHHECARSAGVGVERAAVPTTEEALPRGRRPRPAPRLAREAR